jgi:hypothetical protein
MSQGGMIMPNEKEIMYDRFLELQQQVHLKNQKKIRVGLKVNIILPLIFLAISFLSNRSKLVFLVLWIVSLFGIAFYLLYVEYMDFKLQERMKEFGIIDSEENEALIGNEVVQGMRDINNAQKEMVKDIKERKDEIKKEIKTEVKKVGGKIKK